MIISYIKRKNIIIGDVNISYNMLVELIRAGVVGVAIDRLAFFYRR